jgi:Bacterial Ig domain
MKLIRTTLGVITILMVCAGLNAVVASAAIGDGSACQNQQQWQVDDTPGGTPIGNVSQITGVSLSSTSLSWSLNHSGYPDIEDCATYVYLSNGVRVALMPQGGELYSAPAGLTIVRVEIMAFSAGSQPVGDDCGNSYNLGYYAPNGQTPVGNTTSTPIVVSPSTGPYTSSTGITLSGASGMLMCDAGGYDSDPGGGNPWYSTSATGYTHIPNSGQHVVSFSADAMNAPTPRTDLTPPSVSLTSPANNATVSGTVTLTATATDNVAVAGVEVSLDNGTDLGAGSASGSTYTLNWDSTSVANGDHTLTATATDTGGNTSTSSVVVDVQNTTTTTTTTCPTGETGTPPNCTPVTSGGSGSGGSGAGGGGTGGGGTGTIPTACQSGDIGTPPNCSRPASMNAPVCVVPRLVGQTTKRATHLLAISHCRVGKTKRPRSKPHKLHHRYRLVVASTSPKPGSRRPAGTKVELFLRWM